MSSEIRVCLQCSGRISSLRRSGTKFCSKTCGAINKRNVRQGGKELSLSKLSIKAKKKGSVLFHDCIFGGGEGIDPFVHERCKCKKTVSEERAESLVAGGEALDFETRTPVFAGGAIVQIGKLKRTGRSATVEKAHLERLVGITKSKNKTLKQLSLEELQNKVQSDRAMLQQEESMRLEIYGELTASARQAWIVEVDADVYDAAKDRDYGRALFTTYKEGRTSGGMGIDVDRILGETENADRAA